MREVVRSHRVSQRDEAPLQIGGRARDRFRLSVRNLAGTCSRALAREQPVGAQSTLLWCGCLFPGQRDNSHTRVISATRVANILLNIAPGVNIREHTLTSPILSILHLCPLFLLWPPFLQVILTAVSGVSGQPRRSWSGSRCPERVWDAGRQEDMRHFINDAALRWPWSSDSLSGSQGLMVLKLKRPLDWDVDSLTCCLLSLQTRVTVRSSLLKGILQSAAQALSFGALG